MKKTLLTTIITGLIACTASADLLTVDQASVSSIIAANRTAANTIDGSDLIFAGGDVNDPNNYTSLGDANFGNDDTWISSNASVEDDEWIAFEFASTVNVSSISVFNLGNQQQGYATTRGVLQADVYYRVGGGIGGNTAAVATGASTGAFDTTGWILLGIAGTQNFAQGPDGAIAAGPTQITIAGGINATAIAFDINTTQSGDNRAGLNEVQFFGTIPEPGTYALLAGLLALSAVAVRRRK